MVVRVVAVGGRIDDRRWME